MVDFTVVGMNDDNERRRTKKIFWCVTRLGCVTFNHKFDVIKRASS